MRSSQRIVRLVAFLSTVFFCRGLLAAELKPETVKAWEQYAALTEQRIAAELSAGQGLLVLDSLPPSEATAARQRIFSGEIFVRRMTTLNEEGKEIRIPRGLVHHWVGAMWVRDATLADVLEYQQNYDEHHKYVEEVEDSRLISQEEDAYRVFLRLKRKKGITVFYNTEHAVDYVRHTPELASSKSVATRIVQLENPGTSNELEKPEGNDSGFMWRLNSYWRFQQVADGVVVECESISLSRGIPIALNWLVKPLVNSVPRESLESTLGSLRAVLVARDSRASLHRALVKLNRLSRPSARVQPLPNPRRSADRDIE